jgi:Histidine kinase-, DNA gyrase B-, and HSP90-like ATPase
MNNFVIKPKVDETQEFIEIANDFSNPLDLVREGISNAFDAGAKNIEISFNVVKEFGESNLEITIKDDGTGMNQNGLQSFFDLGNSLSRGNDEKIGEKGHGTKVYFNSSNITVTSVNGGKKYIAIMNDPIRKLHNREIPTVEVSTETVSEEEINGTEIKIKGYNSNRREKFTHEELKDYILWFTKVGSVEGFFDIEENSDVKILLKGLNRKIAETIDFGHSFPNESLPVNKLFDEYLVSAPDHYCKRFIKRGQLKNFPEISYEAIFSVEGNKVKQSHNPMIRRKGLAVIPGSYIVAERYGVWLCKDFIPIQRKNEWVNYKGSEFIKLHSFFNCQGLKLTANRGSIDNTPSEILADIQNEVKAIYEQIVESEDWTQLSWLEQEADGYRTAEKEKKDFEWRLKKVGRTNICNYKEQILVEPQRESGVFALTLQLQILEKGLFPFYILDYDTHSGIDVIVKGDNTTPIQVSKLYYVEFKHYLTIDFNHSFTNLHNIVCWDTTIKHNDILKDVSGEERKMEIIQPLDENDYTKYFLNNPRSAHKIEVFVLKDYLKQKLSIEFRPRTDKDTV